MPEAALPVPHSPAMRGLSLVKREYRDLLMRPLTGSLVLTGAQATEDEDTRISAGAVKVTLVDGVLVLNLPPGEYHLLGTLWSKDEEQTAINETFTVGDF